MDGNEGGGDNPPISKKRSRAPEGEGGSGEESDSSIYLPYFKPNYTRLYPENSSNSEFKVFVEHINPKERLGNKSPTYLNHIFTTGIKGVTAIRRINANKIAVVFKQYNTANNFLNHTHFLHKNNMKAYIPAAQIEKTGIIRFVPANISNKDLYSKLSSVYEIIAVRRFTKKINQTRVPLQTVSITFLSNVLPDNVQYDLFSYRVFEYVAPLQQCYRCFKFNHSAKICGSKQRCSICSGEHLYKDCDKQDEICCINCSGPHLAISKQCPVKIKKITEKKNKISYASVAQTKKPDFPYLPSPSNINVGSPVNKFVNKNVNKFVNNRSATLAAQDVSHVEDIRNLIISNKDVLMALVQTLVELANTSDSSPINTLKIKDMLVKNLSV